MPKKNELEAFMKDPQRNLWIKFDGFEVYVRKGARYINGTRVEKVLDISTIEGFGRTSHSLLLLIKTAQRMNVNGVFFENVLNPLMEETFSRLPGFMRTHETLPCFFWSKEPLSLEPRDRTLAAS